VIDRAFLQNYLKELVPEPGQILVARYSGPKHPKSDVENLLFYNIGSSCFESAFRYGVQFEEMSKPTELSEYRYQFCDPP